MKKTWLWVMLLLLAGLLAALFLLGRGDIRLFQAPSGSPPLPPPDSLIQARCEYVTDGDTAWFRVAENGVPLSHKVRFLNIDAPESGAPGFAEAGGHVRAALAGKTVFLEYDSQRLDRYGRQLCHVWLPDGTLFNLELVFPWGWHARWCCSPTTATPAISRLPSAAPGRAGPASGRIDRDARAASAAFQA